MKTYLKLFAFCLSVLILGCSGMGTKSEHVINAKTDVSVLKTYSWEPGLRDKFSNPVYAEYFMDAMNAKLAAKGYELVSENPHFLIRTHQSKVTKEEIVSYAGRIEVHKAMITIEFLDTKSGEIVYKSAAETHVAEESDPDKMKKDFYENAEGLLKVFPLAVKE